MLSVVEGTTIHCQEQWEAPFDEAVDSHTRNADSEAEALDLCDELRKRSRIAVSMIVQAAVDLQLPVHVDADAKKWQVESARVNKLRQSQARRWLLNQIRDSAFSIEDACDAISMHMGQCGVNVELDWRYVGRSVLKNSESVALLNRICVNREKHGDAMPSRGEDTYSVFGSMLCRGLWE